MPEITDRQKAALVAKSHFLWTLFFYRLEFTVSEDRDDLPEKWRGRQVMSEKQRLMLCDRSNAIAFRTSRKVSKTDFAGSRLFQWTFWHAGKAGTDGMLHCPREHHLTNIRMRIEKKWQRVKLFRVLITNINRSKGILETCTGVTWYMRIEGRTGTGESMVGPAALYEIGDEQDYSDWGAFRERQAAMLPGAKRILCGVPRGVQGGPFWSIVHRSEFGEGWSVYKGEDGFNCFINPIYRSKEARRRLESTHGGKDTQAYQTQVLGLDGMKVFSSFHVVPQVVSDFALIQATGDDVDQGVLLSRLVSELPQTPGDAYIIAGDLGRSPSPTELGVWRLFEGAWVQIARIKITIADSFQTSEAIHEIDRHLPHPALLIGIDAHGQGTGIYDHLRKAEKWAMYDYMSRVIDVEFNSVIEDERIMTHKACKRVVRPTDMGWYCDSCMQPIFKSDDLEPLRVATKPWAFTTLKDCFSAGQRWVMDERRRMDYPPIVVSASDEELLMSLDGTTEKETATGRVQWDAPSRHLIDMMLATTVTVHRAQERAASPVTESWLDEVGWSGGEGEGVSLPWEAMNAKQTFW